MEKSVTERETEPSFRGTVTNQKASQLPAIAAILHPPLPRDSTVPLTTILACPPTITCSAQSVRLKSQGNNVAPWVQDYYNV